VTRTEAALARLGIDARRRGREWWALCPNEKHKDRKPSWHIRDQPGHKKDGMHNCYPCGFGGTLVRLVAHVLKISDDAARDWLGGEEEAPIPAATVLDVRPREKLRVGDFNLPAGVSFAPLAEWPSQAQDYARSRGLTPAQVARWEIGVAVEGRLNGRIVFPVRDMWGRIRSYSARTYTGSVMKYRTPDEREGADPAVVFGERHWPGRGVDENPGSRGRVFVFEGAINALAGERALLETYGVPEHGWTREYACIAALSGSSNALPDQSVRQAVARKLATFDVVVVATDADVAGDRAWEELRGALARHARLVRARLPEGAGGKKGLDAAEVDPKLLAEVLLGG
jgi:DNA primase